MRRLLTLLLLFAGTALGQAERNQHFENAIIKNLNSASYASPQRIKNRWYPGTAAGTCTAPSTAPMVSTESASGGSVTTTTYYYKVTYFNWNGTSEGETTGSGATSFAASSGTTNKIKVQVGDNLHRSGCPFYRVYVSNSSGGTYYLQTPAANAVRTTGHVIPGDIILDSITLSGTTLPSTNTSVISPEQVALNAASDYAGNAVSGIAVFEGNHNLTSYAPLVVSNQQKIECGGNLRRENTSSTGGGILRSTWADANIATVMVVGGPANSVSIEGCEIVGTGHALMIWENASGGNQNHLYRNNSIRSTGTGNTYSAVEIRGVGYDYHFRDNYMRGDKACVHAVNHAGSKWVFDGGRWDAGGSHFFWSESSLTDADRAAQRSGFLNGISNLVLSNVLGEASTGIPFSLTNTTFSLWSTIHADPSPSGTIATMVLTGFDTNGAGAGTNNTVINGAFFQGSANYTNLIQFCSSCTYGSMTIIAPGSSSSTNLIDYNSVNVAVTVINPAAAWTDDGNYINISATGMGPTIIGGVYAGTAASSRFMNSIAGGFRWYQHSAPANYFNWTWPTNGTLGFYSGDPGTTANTRWTFNTNGQTTVLQSDGSTALMTFDGRAAVNVVTSTATVGLSALCFDAANRDACLSRTSANVLQLNSGDTFRPASAGQALGVSGAEWAGVFTSISATGQITSTLSTGTAPFVVASTTNVANLNASSLNGATFAAPGAIGGGTPSTGAFTTLTASTSVSGATILTASNCASSGGTCGSAASGSVSIAAAATTVTVATTAVTANSIILLTEDSTLGTKLGVTCNTVQGRNMSVTTRTAATSFVITVDVAPVTNPMCINYLVIN